MVLNSEYADLPTPKLRQKRNYFRKMIAQPFVSKKYRENGKILVDEMDEELQKRETSQLSMGIRKC